MRILVSQLNPVLGDIKGNLKKIQNEIAFAKKKKSDLIIFPELSLSGYIPDDLLLSSSFQEEMEKALEALFPETEDLMVIVGGIRKNPDLHGKPLFNTAFVLHQKKIVGCKDKTLLPTYDVFDERRYFEKGSPAFVFSHLGKRMALFICEDLWEHAKKAPLSYDTDPLMGVQEKVDLIINISGSPYHFGKEKIRDEVFSSCAQQLNAPLIFCNQVGGQDALLFDGNSFLMNPKGEIVQRAKGFQEDVMEIDLNKLPFSSVSSPDSMESLYQALVMGTRDYFHKQGFSKGLIGVSGGIDSAVVLAIAADALGKENIRALFMPSRYTSQESEEDAKKLISSLGISSQTIGIEDPFDSFLTLLNPFFEGKKEDITEENLQARLRGVILMALANKLGYIVLATSNKSEMAMGYSTLYGDMCGGLAILSDVKKRDVYALAAWINRSYEIIPQRILSKEPSAELKWNQKDSDTLPPYALLDQLIAEYIEEGKEEEEVLLQTSLSREEVKRLIHAIHQAEYKRRQAPLGLRVTKKAFFKGREVPIVQKWK